MLSDLPLLDYCSRHTYSQRRGIWIANLPVEISYSISRRDTRDQFAIHKRLVGIAARIPDVRCDSVSLIRGVIKRTIDIRLIIRFTRDTFPPVQRFTRRFAALDVRRINIL